MTTTHTALLGASDARTAQLDGHRPTSGLPEKCVQTPEVAIAEGRRWGYPECCIQQFAAERWNGRQARERGVKLLRTGVYVPCNECAQLAEPDRPHLNWDQWMVLAVAMAALEDTPVATGGRS